MCVYTRFTGLTMIGHKLVLGKLKNAQPCRMKGRENAKVKLFQSTDERDNDSRKSTPWSTQSSLTIVSRTRTSQGYKPYNEDIAYTARALLYFVHTY